MVDRPAVECATRPFVVARIATSPQIARDFPSCPIAIDHESFPAELARLAFLGDRKARLAVRQRCLVRQLLSWFKSNDPIWAERRSLSPMSRPTPYLSTLPKKNNLGSSQSFLPINAECRGGGVALSSRTINGGFSTSPAWIWVALWHWWHWRSIACGTQAGPLTSRDLSHTHLDIATPPIKSGSRERLSNSPQPRNDHRLGSG